MSIYTNMAATALKQINDKGRNLSLVSDAGSSYDPDTDTFTEETETSSFKGLVTVFKSSDIDGEMILRDDKRILIAAESISKPNNGDKITDGSVTYTVVNTEEVKPGDVAVLYMVQVRR